MESFLHLFLKSALSTPPLPTSFVTDPTSSITVSGPVPVAQLMSYEFSSLPLVPTTCSSLLP